MAFKRRKDSPKGSAKRPLLGRGGSRDPFEHLQEEREKLEDDEQPWFLADDDAEELQVEAGISSNLSDADLAADPAEPAAGPADADSGLSAPDPDPVPEPPLPATSSVFDTPTPEPTPNYEPQAPAPASPTFDTPTPNYEPQAPAPASPPADPPGSGPAAALDELGAERSDEPERANIDQTMEPGRQATPRPIFDLPDPPAAPPLPPVGPAPEPDTRPLAYAPEDAAPRDASDSTVFGRPEPYDPPAPMPSTPPAATPAVLPSEVSTRETFPPPAGLDEPLPEGFGERSDDPEEPGTRAAPAAPLFDDHTEDQSVEDALPGDPPSDDPTADESRPLERTLVQSFRDLVAQAPPPPPPEEEAAWPAAAAQPRPAAPSPEQPTHPGRGNRTEPRKPHRPPRRPPGF